MRTALTLLGGLCLFMFIIAMASCGNGKPGPEGTPGLQGAVGPEGLIGPTGLGCSVSQVSLGAIITCGDGSSALILHGKKPKPECEEQEDD